MVEVMDSIRNFFTQISTAFAELWFWPVVMLSLMLLAVIVMAFLTKFSYENRILKSVNKLNKYFLSKPFITDENLVEFNLKMKKVPKVLRTNWQIYMLNREDSPTTYINVNTCIDKPLRTSSIEKNMSNFSVFTLLLAFLSFVIGLEYSIVLERYELADVLFTALLVPLLIVLIYTISILAIRASKNDIYACLYENFPLYERNLTKAVTTLPSYVDYEILFTKQEIKEGIPILQQYLEKRALVEQQELERARENSMSTEEYDFSDLGIDGSLILERSMKESEIFIKIRKRLEDEIASIEGEQENYRKNYEETVKDMQRKLQASRENLESLKTQMEASTNRIESNYIRKQQADEIKKQQQLEKDIEEATAKFNDEQVSLQQEIEKRKKEIDEKREFVEHAMLLEFKHYANTLYKALTQKATEVGNQKLLTLAQENSDLKALLTDIQGLDGGQEEVGENKNLIHNDDLTAENLYDLTSTDMEDLEGGRETSRQTEIDEDRKIEEKNAEESKNSDEQGVNDSDKASSEDDADTNVDVENDGAEVTSSDDNDENAQNEIGDAKEEVSSDDAKNDSQEEEDAVKLDENAQSQNDVISNETVQNEVEAQNSQEVNNNDVSGQGYNANYNQNYQDSYQNYGNGYVDQYGQNFNNYNLNGNNVGYDQNLGYNNYDANVGGYNAYDPNNQGYYNAGGYNNAYNYQNYNNGYYDPNTQNGYYDINAQNGYYDQYGNAGNVQMNSYAGQNAGVNPIQSGTQIDEGQNSSQVSKEDLEAIQKQIEEENNRLQREKKEFENRINDTLSKISAQADEKKEETKTQKEDDDKESKKEKDKKEEDKKEESDESETSEIERLAKPRKERATSRRNRGRKPQTRTRSSSKNSSEIDELNQEMQKLLDSAKNKNE